MVFYGQSTAYINYAYSKTEPVDVLCGGVTVLRFHRKKREIIVKMTWMCEIEKHAYSKTEPVDVLCGGVTVLRFHRKKREISVKMTWMCEIEKH